jgi:hypothetical protein
MSLANSAAGQLNVVVAFVARDLAVVAWMASSAIPGFGRPGEAGVPQFVAGRMRRTSPIRVSWPGAVSLA